MLELDNFIQETQLHIKNVGKCLSTVSGELVKRATEHDMSKIENEIERTLFVEYTPKLKESTYGSDEYKVFLIEMGKGLQHHYKENRHHPEYFQEEADATFRASPVSCMNLIDIIEMFCDWKAATLRHRDGDLTRSIEQNQQRFGYSDDVKHILLNTMSIFEDERRQ